MNISSAEMSVVINGGSVLVPAAAKTKSSSQPAQKPGGGAKVSPAQSKQMVAEKQGNLENANISTQYYFYGQNNKEIAIKIVNEQTGEVIREIPSKEIQSMQTKMGKLVG
ncbi:MAG: flagellar protein FlaG, partial [Syntrophales bacterium LBB04]|nr:flagellar protein FlaG [Syntrophales bacterium LBB04]